MWTYWKSKGRRDFSMIVEEESFIWVMMSVCQIYHWRGSSRWGSLVDSTNWRSSGAILALQKAKLMPELWCTANDTWGAFVTCEVCNWKKGMDVVFLLMPGISDITKEQQEHILLMFVSHRVGGILYLWVIWINHNLHVSSPVPGFSKGAWTT